MKVVIVGSDNIVDNILVYDSVESAESVFPSMVLKKLHLLMLLMLVILGILMYKSFLPLNLFLAGH